MGEALGLPHGCLVVEYAGKLAPLPPEAVLGEPPLLHGTTVRPGVPGAARDSALAPVAVWVTGGPDVGGTYSLGPGGRLTFGRASWCDVVLDDPGLSRHHLTLSTTRRGILVEDSASTNGTRVGDTLIDGPTIWPPGVPLRAGASTLALVPAAAALPRTSPDGEGRLLMAPRSQSPPPLEGAAFDPPSRITPTAPVAPGALGWLLPMAVSVLLAIVLSMPALLLFGLMAPAMSLGGYVGERRRHRRECAAAEEAHNRALAAVELAALEAVAREAQVRADRAPDLARLLDAARHGGPLLWSRVTAPLVCRLGLATARTAVTVGGLPQPADALPVEADLTHGLSLVGPPDAVRGLARSLLIQLAVLHSPGELAIEIADPTPATGGAAAWDWLAWLPHTGTARHGRTVVDRTVVRLCDLTDQLSHVATTQSSGPAPVSQHSHLRKLDDDVPRTVLITLCRSTSAAPDGSTVVSVHGPTLTVQTDAGPVAGTADLLSARRARRAARILAPLTDGSADDGPGAVPTSLDLASIVPTPITSQALAQHWRDRPRSTRFLLGQDATGALALDLAADGPHALVAGTTGSGKSELLRTLVTSLALANRPDELVMVLVDYKGGSAFAEAAALPHVVGVITDLDPHLADRALTSLTAELKRRERILAAAGVPDLPAYQALSTPEPVPRLVIVIDEFRALAEELPDFLDGLVRIAALGRSLGVHLVLATQRPGGVISADVRANVNLRIALRVRDGSDSYDVLDSPAAAELPEGVPGRALIRTGADAPRVVQVASSSTPTAGAKGQASESVSIIPVHDLWAADVHDSPDEVEIDEGASTLATACAATTEAASLVGAVPPASPWLPALPPLVRLADLPPPAPTPGWGSVPLMLTDLPAQQRQPVHHWHPLSDGHLGIAGSPRSGRSSAARSVLAGLLARDPADAHVYAFDLAGSLGPLASAPQVGALLAARDVARGCRVIEHLTQVLAQRQQSFAAGGFTSLAEQRERADRPWPLVVLVVDGWPRFAELYGAADRGRPLEQVQQVLREGLAVGIVAVLTGDRSLLAGRIAPLVSELWSLRLTDPADLLMAGLTRAQVPARMPSGRVVRLRDGVVGQVAVVGSAADGARQVAALTEQVAGLTSPVGDVGTTRFRPLPQTVTVEALDPGAIDGLVVGVGGDAADPVALPVPTSGQAVLGIVGPPGSGRSTTLRTLEQAATDRGWVVVVADESHAHDPFALERLLPGPETSAIVTVDGLDRLAGTAAEDVLLTWLDTPGGPGTRLVVAAGEPDDLGGFRGLAARVGRGRAGIVLQPSSPADGSGLGASVPTGDERLPGRGVLVVRGACSALQVALPSS